LLESSPKEKLREYLLKNFDLQLVDLLIYQKERFFLKISISGINPTDKRRVSASISLISPI